MNNVENVDNNISTTHVLPVNACLNNMSKEVKAEDLEKDEPELSVDNEVEVWELEELEMGGLEVEGLNVEELKLRELEAIRLEAEGMDKELEFKVSEEKSNTMLNSRIWHFLIFLFEKFTP